MYIVSSHRIQMHTYTREFCKLSFKCSSAQPLSKEVAYVCTYVRMEVMYVCTYVRMCVCMFKCSSAQPLSFPEKKTLNPPLLLTF